MTATRLTEQRHPGQRPRHHPRAATRPRTWRRNPLPAAHRRRQQLHAAGATGGKSEIRNPKSEMKEDVLVVEDDAHIRLGLCDALRGEAYEVTDCRDGAQAMPIIRQRRPDLVILDIMLPGKSGFDLC